ncbi:MAG TPA: hypothetical protein PJ994_04345 [Tepidiformaceae bacterium]|nr:hypothetical protein [Tepidiformaceae bacterium]HMO96317.1 hypothetical protein [Tepidiformaceae bacterium]
MLEIIAHYHIKELAVRQTELRFREEYETSRRVDRLQRTLSVNLARLGLRLAASTL